MTMTCKNEITKDKRRYSEWQIKNFFFGVLEREKMDRNQQKRICLLPRTNPRLMAVKNESETEWIINLRQKWVIWGGDTAGERENCDEARQKQGFVVHRKFCREPVSVTSYRAVSRDTNANFCRFQSCAASAPSLTLSWRFRVARPSASDKALGKIECQENNIKHY